METFFYEDNVLMDDYIQERTRSRITSIVFSKVTSGLMFASTQKNFFVSEDNGVSWELRSNFGELTFNEILDYHEILDDIICSNTSNRVFLVTSNGNLGTTKAGKLLRSDDTALSWTDITSEILELVEDEIILTKLPEDSEFDNGLANWTGVSYLNFPNTWSPLMVDNDNGISAPIQDNPFIELGNNLSVSVNNWPISGAYVLNIKAILPPQSKMEFSLNIKYPSVGSGGFPANVFTPLPDAIFINDSEEEQLVDQQLEIGHAEVMQLISSNGAIESANHFWGVGLHFEPLAGNTSSDNVWLGRYSFSQSYDGELGFLWMALDVVGQNIFGHGKVKVAMSGNQYVFKSSDDGQTWVRISPQASKGSLHKHTMRVSPSDNEIKYFAGETDIYRTDGESSENILEDLHVDIRNIQLVENGVTNSVYAVTDGGINRSDDGGQNWSSLNGDNLGITQFYELAVLDTYRNTVLAGAQDGNNYKLVNGEWQEMPGSDVHGIEFIDENKYIAYDNGVIRIRDMNSNSNIDTEPGTFKLPLPLMVNRTTETAYFGKKGGLIKYNLNDPFNASNLLDSTIDNTRYVKCIGLFEKNEDILFCGLNGYDWDNENYAIFMRSTNGGTTWIDLTPVLHVPGDSPVTDSYEVAVIEVDPDDPNRVWVGFSGILSDYSGTATDRVLFTENALADPEDVIWQDVSAGLPPLPVNDLVYQYGSEDVLYAATDVGVFFYDGIEEEWKCFNENLPVCFVTSLKIQYCEQKLYASTYGRGVWRADILRPGTQTLTENLIIDVGESRMFKTNLELESGVTLTVKGELLMPDDATIRVNPNAKVIINGGRIDNACDGMWRGIEVIGTSSQPQLEVYQGKVEMYNGGSIENAILGVSLGVYDENGNLDLSTAGGFIVCNTGAKFINCQRAVKAYDYQGPFNNCNKFFNTTFEINDELRDGSNPYSQIHIRGVHGVIVQNCEFINTRTDEFPILDAGQGITAANAGFRVHYCNFENLELGIGVKSLGFDDIKISENTFTGNLGGVSLRYSGLAEVIQNDFNIPAVSDLNLGSSHPEVVAFGVYLGGSTGFLVEENTFYSDVIEQNVGVAVHNSGPDPNRIYNNEFGRLGAGIIAMGNNRGTNIYHGLLFECNDLGTFDHPLGSSLALTNEGEVRHYQGYLGDDGGAANVFEPVCNPITLQEREFYVGDDTPPFSPVLYFPYSQENTRPDCHTPDMVTVPNSDEDLNKDIRCPSNFFSGGSIGDIKEKYVANKSIYNGLRLVYSNEYNGGDIEYLRDLIDNPTVSSFDLRNELMLASPRVTSRLLIAAIQRDPEMNPWHLAQVLLANSPLTQDVINALNQSDVNPYYRELVLDGQYGGMSNTAIMESELGHFGGLMEFARIDYVRQLFRQDSTYTWNDSIIHYLGSDASPHLMKTMMSYHIKRNQWQSAQDLLGEASNLRWSSDYVDLVGILIDALSDSANADDVIANNTTQLLAIAADNSTEAFLAQSILEAFELAEFPDYIEMPTIGTTKLFKDKKNVKEPIKPIASMHPNPAKDMIYLNWRLPEGMPAQSISLVIYNGQGMQLLTRSITSEVGIEEFNTTDWPSGLYIYQVLHDNKPIHHGKFEVLR